MAGDRVDVAQADIEFRIDTHDVRGDIAATKQVFLQATHEMSTEALQLAVALEKRDKALAKYGANSTQAKSAEIALRRATEQATTASQKHSRGLDDESRSLNKLIRGSIAGSGVLQSLGRQIAFASGSFLGGAGLTYALTSTLRVAGEFEQQMNILQVVSSATAEQIGRAADEAKALGRDLTLPATSAKDAAVAMTELAKAGLSVEQATAAARGTLQLAAAASIDAASAAKITASALNAFGLSGDQATKVADQLAAAANAAQGEIPDMALALKQASTVAHSFGLTTGETIAALTQLAKAGVVGSDAGTSLRVMLTYLVPKSKQAAEVMDQYGLSVKSAGGGFLTLREIIDKYQGSLARLAPYERQQVLRTIFGADAQRAAGIILTRTAGAHDQLRKAIERVGAAAELGGAKNKGYLGSVDAFKSAIETLQISVGQNLLPTFTENIRVLAAWVNRVEESGKAAKTLGDSVQQTVGTFKAAKDVIQPVVDVLGGFQNVVGLIVAIKVTRWAQRWAGGFGIIAASSAATKTKVVIDAAEIEAALDAATRPRNVVITTTTTGIPVGGGGGKTGKVGKLGGLLGFFAGGPVGLAISAGAASYLYNQGKRNAEKAKWDSLTPEQQREWLRGKGLDNTKDMVALLNEIGWKLKPIPVIPGQVKAPDEGTRGANDAYRRRRGRGGGTLPGTSGFDAEGLTKGQRLDLELQAAENSGDLSRQFTAARRILAYRRLIEKNSNATGDALYDIKQKTLTAEQRVNQLQDQIDDKRTQDAQRAATRAEKAERDRKAAELRAERIRSRDDPGLRGIHRAERAARGTAKDFGDDIDAAEDDVKYWRDRLAKTKKTSGAYDYIVGELEKAKAKLDTQRAKARRAAETTTAAALELPRALRIQKLEAELTADEQDDITADKKIEAHWRRKLNRAKEGSAEYEAILEQLVASKTGRSSDSATAEQMGSFFRDFLNNWQRLMAKQFSTIAGGTGTTLSTNVLEQMTMIGNTHLSEIARGTRVPRGWQRASDEAAFS